VVAGLILTGGASRRMGRDKATLTLPNGDTCSGTVAARLALVTRPVLEVGPGVSGPAWVPDAAPDSGPLAAMATGWAALKASGFTGAVIVVACDLPMVAVPLLKLLARMPGEATVVPLVNGKAQSLCARYSPASLNLCQILVSDGCRSLRTLLRETDVTLLQPESWGQVVDEQSFTDLDTPEDLARFVESTSNGHGWRSGVPHASVPPWDPPSTGKRRHLLFDTDCSTPTLTRGHPGGPVPDRGLNPSE
jgi:molybdopterin-guanine dinucleotide biosynthesis protein A